MTILSISIFKIHFQGWHCAHQRSLKQPFSVPVIWSLPINLNNSHGIRNAFSSALSCSNDSLCSCKYFSFVLFCLHWYVELLGEQGFCKSVLDVIQHKGWRVWLLLKLILLIHWKNSNVSINPLQLKGFHIALYVVLWKRKGVRFMVTELSWQIFRWN